MFVAYRILLAVYLAGLTVAHIVDRRHTDGARWLIFITNWSFLLFLAATTLAAIMTLIFTMQPSKLVKSRRPRANTKISSDTKNSERAQTNNNRGDDINWSVKMFWVLYITSHTVTVMVCIGFWSTQYEPCIRGTENNTTLAASLIDRNTSTGSREDCGVDFLSIHVHGINAVLVICDIVLSLVPFNALHFLYPCIFTLNYVVFSGIYHAANGTNESGDPYIYSILNYAENPVMSSVAAILLVFLPAAMYVIPLLVACARDRVYQWMTERCNTFIEATESETTRHK